MVRGRAIRYGGLNPSSHFYRTSCLECNLVLEIHEHFLPEAEWR
jgi:hypothetical protein